MRESKAIDHGAEGIAVRGTYGRRGGGQAGSELRTEARRRGRVRQGIPLSGQRTVRVAQRRTRTDWAHFLNNIAQLRHRAEKITLDMDNLNTHGPGSLYDTFEPGTAKALWDRFEFVYTPKHGSWLNMAEIELNVPIRQCLDRRIGTIGEMRHEVAAWQERRNNANVVIDWQFTATNARTNLKRLYPTLQT